MLSLEWGVWNRQAAEVVRKEYYGTPRISPVTNESELHYASCAAPSRPHDVTDLTDIAEVTAVNVITGVK